LAKSHRFISKTLFLTCKTRIAWENDMLQIRPLREHPDAIPGIARWRFDQWGHEIPGSSLDTFTQSLIKGLEDDGLPQTWIVLSAGRVVGVASLAEHDMHTRQDLSPWLVGVYVNQADRGHGVGSALVSYVMERAAKMGIETLWLFTPDQEHFYQRLGWQSVERTRYRGHDVVVMNVAPKQQK
jgi:N-acetylglutamate synthase-like GNAT family acetyltransferase